MALNLQIVLLGIGFIVVLAVYLISKWQSRSQAAQKFAGAGRRNDARPNPILGDLAQFQWRAENLPGRETTERRQPHQPRQSLHAEHSFLAPAQADPDALAQPAEDLRTPRFPSASDLPSAEQTNRFRRRPAVGFEQLSQIDYWVKITGQRDVGRETVLGIYRDRASHFTKASHFHGRKVGQHEWCDVQHQAEASRFDDLVLSLQLADRNGALSEREMTRFLALVAKLAECTERKFALMTNVENALAQAAALAEFIRHFDAVCALHISPQPHGEPHFTGAAIERCAAQAGLARDGDHYACFKAGDANQAVLYSLADADKHNHGRFDFADLKSLQTDGVIFFTRPALHRAPGAVVTEMLDAAHAFAANIKGEIKVVGRVESGEAAVHAMRQSIHQAAAEMTQLGIPPGGDEAVRLFSASGATG